MEKIEKLQALQRNIESVLLGKPDVIRQVLVGLLAGGHILLEDVPGVGKTVLTQTIAKSIDCKFNRIQLTPDLLPSDILGVTVYDSKTSTFTFREGPIFAQIVLVDEINRTTPRTQSALLEAMCESQVSIEGKTYPLGPPFMVMATQNPYEFEGTYFLPENQLDRFMLRIRMGYPDRRTELEILKTQPKRTRLGELKPVMHADDLIELQKRVLRVTIKDEILDYIIDIAEATRNSNKIAIGLSPRSAIALTQAAKASALLDGRDYVVPDDVKDMATGVCAHRLVTQAFSHEESSSAAEAIFEQILQTIPMPQ